jgi:hypothetical protein
MRRAGAFLTAAVGILTLSLVVTGGSSILAAGIVAVIAGLAFAAWPVEGMSIVGFIVCIPIVVAQAAVGIPSVLLWLAACGAVVFGPPAGGLIAFVLVRDSWGDAPAVFFLIGFLAAWLAARKVHRTLVRQTATAMSDLIKPLNEPVEELRKGTFAYFEDVGKWMTE